jgi:hypothetical protein
MRRKVTGFDSNVLTAVDQVESQSSVAQQSLPGWTAFGFVVATQTASAVVRTQSAVPPTLNVATDFKEANGT